MASDTAIQPILVSGGGCEKALQMSDALAEKGFLISAIRPPTVPEHTARLRVTLNATHTETQVDQLLTALSEVAA